jgi:hypothetical protein
MKAWIEPSHDLDQNILSIDEYEGEILIRSTNWLYRPLPWTLEIGDIPNE